MVAVGQLWLDEVLPAACCLPVGQYGRVLPPSHWGGSPEFSLLEREAEITSLAEEFERACAGSGRVVLVEGEAGIGKSSLLAELKARASASGAAVLAARGGELERDFAYGVVRQLFEPLFRTADATRRRRLLQGAAEMAAPILGFSEATAGGLLGTDASLAANHGLYWLTSNLSEDAPLLLLVDDAHWCDVASLLFLHYLGLRIEGLTVLVALGLRLAQPGSSWELLDALRDLRDSASVRPSRLSPAAAAQVIRRSTGQQPHASFLAACQEATGGNPFLLGELLRAFEPEGLRPDEGAADRIRGLGPRSISRSVLGRLAVMWPEAVALARAVAVLDTDAELAHAAALADIPLEQAAAAADALTDADVLAAGRPLRFTHPIIRQAVYEDMAERRRALDHGRAAAILGTRGQPERAAVHLLATEPAGDPHVVSRLRGAAQRSLERGAPGAAVALLRRALHEPPPEGDRFSTTFQLGRAARLAGDPAAVELLRNSLELATAVGEHVKAGRELGAALVAAGSVEDAVRVLDDVSGALGPEASDERVLVEAELLTASTFDDVLAARAAERIDNLLEQVTGATPAERVLLAGAAFHRVAAGTGVGEQIAELAEAATAGGMIVREQGAGSLYPSIAVACLLFTDHLDSAEAVIEAMAEDARRTGSPTAHAWYSAMRSRYDHVRGKPPAAEEHARNALEVFPPALTLATEMALAFLVFALVEQGKLDDAEAELALHHAGEGSLSPTTSGMTLLLARSALRLDQGRLDDARLDAEEVVRREGQRGGSLPGRGYRWIPILALRAAGRQSMAVELARNDVAAARRFAVSSTEGIALTALGAVEGGAKGIAHLRAGVGILEHSPRRLDHAHALVELGAALRRAKHRSDSRDPLGRGMDLAHRLGAAALAERARQELLALGARPRRLVLTGVDSLTASERRVGQLAAEGMSNPEIAQALFVTRKTVEAHLMSVYRKLDVTRDGLPEALATPAR